MKKILVPFDFSKSAINAFRFALDMAIQSKGAVYLLHVIELPVTYDTALMPPLYFEEAMLKDMDEHAKKEFAKIIEKYKTENVDIITKVEFGIMLKTIMDYIDAQAIDLIVMGSHGTNGFKEHFIGSNAEKIVRHSQVPVMVMKNYFKGPVKNIVFPNTLDTESQEDLIMKVKALQKFFTATLHIVWINTPTNFTSDLKTDSRLKAFAKRFLLKDFTINIFNDHFEEDGIINFTKFINGDMVAMGTHGRKGISHILAGSLTEDVVNHIDKPIWTYSLKK